MKGASEYAGGNLAYKIDVTSDDEMGYLAKTLNYMSDELNKNGEYQRKFIANVSHDFRSPLTSIKGYVNAILDGTIPYEMQERYLKIIAFESERLEKLTRSLLTLNELDMKKRMMHIQRFDINDTIKNTAATFEGICTSRQIRLELLLSGHELYVRADMEQIQQVLYNLLDNAIKFSNDNSSVQIETTVKSGKVFVSVKDYGTGIAGDLFVHVLASLHYITDAIGPEKVYTTGGIRHYTDGYRDTPDVMLAYLDYPDREDLGAFTVQLGANYVDGVSRKWGSMDFRIVGSEGTLDVAWDKVTLKTLHKADTAFLQALEPIGQGIDTPVVKSEKEIEFIASSDYKGGHYDHFENFITGIRNKTPLICDVMFSVRSAAPALLSYESYERGEAVYWDAENLKERKK